MKIVISLLMFFVVGQVLSQSELSESNARILIGEFFKGFHTKDTVKMKSVTVPNFQVQSAYVSKTEGNKVTYSRGSDFLKMIAARPEDQKWEERILDYTVLCDGNLAQVWTPYEFWFNDTFSHCGANSFTLILTEEGWKIMDIIDSRRKKGCQ